MLGSFVRLAFCTTTSSSTPIANSFRASFTIASIALRLCNETQRHRSRTSAPKKFGRRKSYRLFSRIDCGKFELCTSESKRNLYCAGWCDSLAGINDGVWKRVYSDAWP
ncbi:hypothetical protein EDC04DRAFT_1388189 [Pisolithus marmoratus]|nr:hypothetical protein EDC04DRAFT_1388189 [Pisolithus marmoratus]